MMPQKLYKYQPVNLYSLQNLTRRQLYFSKPENLNDPYDCDPPFEIAKTHRTQKNIKLLFDKIRSYEIERGWIDRSRFDQLYLTNGKPDNRFRRKYIDNIKSIKAQISEKVGVTCFSKRPDNFLLWSYYADNHKGFCVEFDINALLYQYPGTKLYRVSYPKTVRPTRFSILEIVSNPNLLEKILTRKSNIWKHEQEWRLFCRTGGNEPIGYDPKTVTKIYFGYKMPYEHKEIIIKTLLGPDQRELEFNNAAMGPSHVGTQIFGTNIYVYDMKLNPKLFTVELDRFRPKT